MKLITFDDIVKTNISPCTCYTWVSENIANKYGGLTPPWYKAARKNVY